MFCKFVDLAIWDHQLFRILLSHYILSWVFNVSAREHLDIWKYTTTCDVTWYYYHQVLTCVGAINPRYQLTVTEG